MSSTTSHPSSSYIYQTHPQATSITNLYDPADFVMNTAYLHNSPNKYLPNIQWSDLFSNYTLPYLPPQSHPSVFKTLYFSNLGIIIPLHTHHFWLLRTLPNLVPFLWTKFFFFLCIPIVNLFLWCFLPTIFILLFPNSTPVSPSRRPMKSCPSMSLEPYGYSRTLTTSPPITMPTQQSINTFTPSVHSVFSSPLNHFQYPIVQTENENWFPSTHPLTLQSPPPTMHTDPLLSLRSYHLNSLLLSHRSPNPLLESMLNHHLPWMSTES
jgi:hypothetical protein